MRRAEHGAVCTWRWTGETVELVFIHQPRVDVVEGVHDPLCATLATVRRSDGTLLDVPFSTLRRTYARRPDPRRFHRLPHPERTPA